MGKTTVRRPAIDRALGWLGLALLGLTGWAVDLLALRTPIAGVFARVVLQCVAAIGWVVDRLPFLSEARPSGRQPADSPTSKSKPIAV
jgi:hypothetical protein